MRKLMAMPTCFLGLTLLLLGIGVGTATAQQPSCQGAAGLQVRDLSAGTHQSPQASTQGVEPPAKSKASWERLNGPYGKYAESMIGLAGGVLIAYAGDAAYRSTDNGDSRTRLRVSGRELATPSGSDDTAFMAGRSIWRSTDRGASWEELSFIPDSVGLNARYGGCFFDLATPSDSTIVAAFYAQEEIATHCPDYEIALSGSTKEC